MSFFDEPTTAPKKIKIKSTPNKGKATRLKTQAASHANCNDLHKAFLIQTAFLLLQSCPYQLAKDSFKSLFLSNSEGPQSIKSGQTN